MFRLGRKVAFGPIFCAVGTRGFFGERYPFHEYWRCAGMTWEEPASPEKHSRSNQGAERNLANKAICLSKQWSDSRGAFPSFDMDEFR